MANIHDINLIGDSQNKEWRNFDKQLLFDGVNDRVQTIDLTQDIRVGKTFTAAMWVKNIAFNSTLFAGSLNLFFYGYSSNNLLGNAQQINEINFTYINPTTLNIAIIARNGDNDQGVGISGLTAVGGSFDVLNLGEIFHVCFTNEWTGTDNFWKMYVNGNKVLEGNTIFIFGNPPPASGIILPPDPNYISGMGFAKNRNNLATGYMNNSLNEAIFANVAISGQDVRKLFHCSSGDYANYPVNLMSNRILHLPMNSLSDFIDNGIGNPIDVIDVSSGANNAILTGQSFPPTLTNFY